MPAAPWYTRFDELFNRVEDKRERYTKRCAELGVPADVLHHEMWNDLLARIVHESNWQENLRLGLAETKELTDLAFDHPLSLAGPHLDAKKICEDHRTNVLSLKRAQKTVEEIAAYNLAVAHTVVVWLSRMMLMRLAGPFLFVINAIRAVWGNDTTELATIAARFGTTSDEIMTATLEIRTNNPLPEELKQGLGQLDNLYGNTDPMYMPVTGDNQTIGSFARALSDIDWDKALTQMAVQHVHLLHHLTMMGLAPPSKCGEFRKGAVHVGNLDLIFPVAAAVPGLMDEYCRNFRTPLTLPHLPPEAAQFAPYVSTPDKLILLAAEQSHHFVRIHPYSDGNGRVSRLLMNLVLRFVYPPVYIKADKTGRHRYSQALRRADNGKFKPLACLILMSLDAIYDKLLASVMLNPASR